MTTEKLQPCPFKCEWDNAMEIIDQKASMGILNHWVECLCGARGPVYSSRADNREQKRLQAVWAWNERCQ